MDESGPILVDPHVRIDLIDSSGCNQKVTDLICLRDYLADALTKDHTEAGGAVVEASRRIL